MNNEFSTNCHKHNPMHYSIGQAKSTFKPFKFQIGPNPFAVHCTSSEKNLVNNTGSVTSLCQHFSYPFYPAVKNCSDRLAPTHHL